jgi:ketopantoate reductase
MTIGIIGSGVIGAVFAAPLAIRRALLFAIRR